jgi:hypothetical protein
VAQDKLLALARTMRSTAEAIIQEIEEGPQAEPSTPPADYVAMSTFAEQMNVSVNTVRGWIRLGLPTITIGRVVRVRVKEARGWLEQGGDRTVVRRLATLSARTVGHGQKAGLRPFVP